MPSRNKVSNRSLFFQADLNTFVTIIINAVILLLYSRVDIFSLSDHFKLNDKLEAIQKDINV